MVHALRRLEFRILRGREVISGFNGRDISSDVGVLLVAEAERKPGLIGRFAAVMKDERDAREMRHGIEPGGCTHFWQAPTGVTISPASPGPTGDLTATAICTLDITGATVGLRDVTVTNTDAQSGTHSDRFEVVPGDVSPQDIAGRNATIDIGDMPAVRSAFGTNLPPASQVRAGGEVQCVPISSLVETLHRQPRPGRR